jgi:hypothetical protein
LGCEKRRLTVTVPSAAMHERTLVVTVAIFLNLAAARRHVCAVVFGGREVPAQGQVKAREKKVQCSKKSRDEESTLEKKRYKQVLS